MSEWFSHVASEVSEQVGSAWVFCASLAAILAWLAAGPFYAWSELWQNVMTVLLSAPLAILILHTQNRDTKALHVKLGELVVAQPGARNQLAHAEDLEDTALDRAKGEQS